MTGVFGTLVSKKLWDEKERKTIGQAIAGTNRELVGSGSDTLQLLVRKSSGAEILSATGTASASQYSWDTVSVTVDKRIHYDFYVPFLHQKLGKVDFIKNNIEVAMQEIARKEDRYVLEAAMGYTKVEDEDVGTGDGSTTEFALDHSPVLEVISVEEDGTATTDYTVDYDDGKIKFGTAPDTGVAITATYAYADSNTNYTVVDTAGTLDLDDILEAIAALKARGFSADYLILPPRGQYLLTTELYGKYQFVQTSTKIPGLVGAIGDTKVIVTDLLPEGVAIVLKGPPDNPAVVRVYASDIEVRKWERPDYARTDVFLDLYMKPVRVLDDAVQVIIGFASDAY